MIKMADSLSTSALPPPRPHRLASDHQGAFLRRILRSFAGSPPEGTPRSNWRIHPGGEVAAARAAGKAGTAYILSTISGHKLEDVKAGSSGPVFYQLYLMGGRAAAEAVIERARVARFAGLVVTIDTPVSGIRERDYRNGMKELLSGSLLEKIPFLPQVLSSPLRGRGITYHSPVQTFSSRAVGNGGIGLRCALVS